MKEHAFSRQLRLLKASEFKRVFDHTELRSSSPHILILAASNQLDHPRLGFVLAKKQIKHAVQRNRVKRLVRESYRNHQHQLLAADYVILARSGIIELDNREIRDMIDALWFKLKPPKHGKPSHRRRRQKA